jgi:hypothetical protein
MPGNVMRDQLSDAHVTSPINAVYFTSVGRMCGHTYAAKADNVFRDY